MTRLSLLEAVAEAARELDLCEDLGEPIGPGQDPLDWNAYNAVRRRLYDALARLDAFDKEQEIARYISDYHRAPTAPKEGEGHG